MNSLKFKKINAVLFLYIISFCSVLAQPKDPLIVFEQKEHNFGLISESDGVVSYRFWFENKGRAPLVIRQVNTVGGATMPKFSKAPVLQGERSYIEIGYNPTDRPGPFQQKIVILTNAINSNTYLEIKGEVRSKTLERIENPSTIKDKYKFPFGPVLLSNNHIAFSKINKNQTLTQTISFYNPTERQLVVKCSSLPAHIKAGVTPEIIKPGQEGEISVHYDAAKKQDWGFVYDRIALTVNMEPVNGKSVLVSANILEDFGDLTPEERDKAPKIVFENSAIDFGTVKQNDTISFQYKFTNQGKSNLIIRKVKPSCGCTASKFGNGIVKPGETSFVEATFKSGVASGRQNKSISVISNDPVNPMINLSFTGLVQKEAE